MWLHTPVSAPTNRPDKESSIPAQLQSMRQYADQGDWEIVEEFVEPGASARTADGPELRRLLAKCRNRHDSVDVVFVHKIDRLARNVAGHAANKAPLQKVGIRLVPVTENFEDSASGHLAENILAAMRSSIQPTSGTRFAKGYTNTARRRSWPQIASDSRIGWLGSYERRTCQCQPRPANALLQLSVSY